MTHDRSADAAGVVAATIPTIATIVEVNQYLQAGAFIAAIISGLCAAVYYIRRVRTPKD